MELSIRNQLPYMFINWKELINAAELMRRSSNKSYCYCSKTLYILSNKFTWIVIIT